VQAHARARAHTHTHTQKYVGATTKNIYTMLRYSTLFVLLFLGYPDSSGSYCILRLYIVRYLSSTVVLNGGEFLFKNVFLIVKTEMKRGEFEPTICTISLIGKRN
jgi:hypothetical protein